LELIWTLRENGVSEIKSVLDITSEKNPAKIVKKMENENLIYIKNEHIYLTAAGESYAEKIIRRHRLAERLFQDVFSMDETSFEKEACTWEHVLSEEVTDSVCTFLGHPRVCPHNKPIPPGKCCKKYKKEVSPLVQPLNEIEIGTAVKIVYILPSLTLRLKRLTNLGIIPGNIIRIKQKSPALVVIVDETTIALDKEVASEIFVLYNNK
jgi:DtxR family Mn-dependent transcriptional regulator